MLHSISLSTDKDSPPIDKAGAPSVAATADREDTAEQSGLFVAALIDMLKSFSSNVNLPHAPDTVRAILDEAHDTKNARAVRALQEAEAACDATIRSFRDEAVQVHALAVALLNADRKIHATRGRTDIGVVSAWSSVLQQVVTNQQHQRAEGAKQKELITRYAAKIVEQLRTQTLDSRLLLDVKLALARHGRTIDASLDAALDELDQLGEHAAARALRMRELVQRFARPRLVDYVEKLRDEWCMRADLGPVGGGTRTCELATHHVDKVPLLQTHEAHKQEVCRNTVADLSAARTKVFNTLYNAQLLLPEEARKRLETALQTLNSARRTRREARQAALQHVVAPVLQEACRQVSRTVD